MGDLRFNFWFGVSQTVAKRVIFGTPFYYRFIRRCFPNEIKVVPKDSRRVQFLTEVPESSFANMLDDEETSSTSDSGTFSSDEGQGDKEKKEMILASKHFESLQVRYNPTDRFAKAQWLYPST